MESTRQNKISRLLQKDLGEIFQFEGRSIAGKAMVTVTKVSVTPDLSIARVYLSIFAAPDKKEVLENVRKHTSEVRYKLGNRVGKQLRKVPALEFFEDDSLDYIENIEGLLND